MQGSAGLTVEKFKKSRKKSEFEGEYNKSKPKNKKPFRKNKREEFYEDQKEWTKKRPHGLFLFFIS